MAEPLDVATAPNPLRSGAPEVPDEFVELSSGDRVPLIPGGFRGYVETVGVQDGELVVAGWAHSGASDRPPDELLALVGDRRLEAVVETHRRPDVVARHGTREDQQPGFRIRLGLTRNACYQELRVVAAGPDCATALPRLFRGAQEATLRSLSAGLAGSELLVTVDHIHYWQGRLQVVGWAASLAEGAPFDRVEFVPDQGTVPPGFRMAVRRVPRFDVAERYQKPELMGSGFRLLAEGLSYEDCREGLYLVVSLGQTNQRVVLEPPTLEPLPSEGANLRMLVNDEFRFGYGHVPKTGGTFLTRILARLAGTRYVEGAEIHGPVAPVRHVHPDYFLFSTIRNPYDWYVSLFSYLNSVYNSQWPRSFFPEFLRTLLTPATALTYLRFAEPGNDAPAESASGRKIRMARAMQSTRLPLGWLTLRHLFCCREDFEELLALGTMGALREALEAPSDVAAVLRLEHLSGDLKAAFEGAGIELPSAIYTALDREPPRNRFRRDPYPEYYDEALCALVRERDQLLFDRFGYEF